MTIADAIKKGTIELKENNIDTPRLKAILIMQFILNVTRQYIIANDMKNVDIELENKYFSAIDKIKTGMPLEDGTQPKKALKSL